MKDWGRNVSRRLLQWDTGICHFAIGTEELSPLVSEMGVPDNEITGGLGILDIKRNLSKPYFDLEPQLKTSLGRAKSSEINVS